MNREYQDFCAGILIGILILCVILAVLRIVNWKSEYAVYENELVIKYHNPNKEYDREMVRNMVNDSQMWTNFVVKEIKMGKHEIEYRMSNPKEGVAK